MSQDIIMKEDMERRFPVVVQALQNLSEDGDSKARGYLCSIKQFDFIIVLCAAEHVLANTVALSNMLQGKSINLLEALKEARVVINVITEERNDPMVWDALYECAEGMAAECGIEPSMPRLAVAQQHRVNVPADTPKQCWRRAVYLPLLDHMVQELNDRLLCHNDRFLGQYLLPSNVSTASREVLDKIHETYRGDLSDKVVYDNKVIRWKTKWAHTLEKPNGLVETIETTNEVLYPNVTTVLTILLTMPVSTATPERSFTVMRRFKSYMRSTMKTERLSALVLMHAYRDSPIDTDIVIREFCAKKNRRLAFEL